MQYSPTQVEEKTENEDLSQYDEEENEDLPEYYDEESSVLLNRSAAVLFNQDSMCRRLDRIMDFIQSMMQRSSFVRNYCESIPAWTRQRMW